MKIRKKPYSTDWLQIAQLSGVNQPRVFSLIGGGGKTSLMFHWAACLLNAGIAVVSATTTKLAATPQAGVCFCPVDSLSAATRVIAQSKSQRSVLCLVRGLSASPGKFEGLDPLWIDELARQLPDTFFLVEADGSAGRSLKGHLPYEPVIPASSSLVVPVFGLDCLGQKIDGESVHRPERLRQIIGIGETPAEILITPELLVSVLYTKGGYLEKAPKDAFVLPYLNKLENRESYRQARQISDLIVAAQEPRIAAVLGGSIRNGCLLRLR